MKKKKVLELTTVITFGKCKGFTVAEIAKFDRPYLRWLVDKHSGVVSDDVSLLIR